MVFGINFGSSTSKNAFNQQQQNSVDSPDWWKQGTENLNDSLTDFAKQYGYGNLTPDQQAASDNIAARAANPGAEYWLNAGIAPVLNGYSGVISNVGAGANYSLTKPAPQVAASGVSADTAYGMSQPYRDAYGTGVLDPALDDYDTGVDRAANSYRAGTLTAAPNTRQSVGAGVLAGEAARGRGTLSAGIRSDILDKSFGFGGSDAGMKLSADTTTANNSQMAATGNADRQQSRDIENLHAQIQGDQTKLQAFNQAAALVQQMGTNALNGENQSSQNAVAALQAAGIPVDQAMALIQAQIAGLNAATPGFGSSTTESGNSTGKNTSLGFSAKV